MKAAIFFLSPIVLLGGAITDVQNAASWNLGARVIAPGEIATVLGSGFANFGVEVVNKQFPLPSTLGGVQVQFNGSPGGLLYVTPTQINVQVPKSLVIGNATVTVLYNNQVVATTTISVSTQAPGIFAYFNGTISSPIITLANGALVSMPGFPAVEVGPTGTYIVLYGSGFGPTNSDTFTGQPTQDTILLYQLISKNVSAALDNVPIQVAYIGLSPGSVGLYQVNLYIPATVKAGTHTLALRIGGVDLPDIRVETITPIAVIK